MAPNNSVLHYKGSKHDNQTGSRIATPDPALASCPPYSPTLAPRPLCGPTLAPTTRFFISRAPNMVTRLEVELQPLHWLPTRTPCNRFHLKSIHKGILTE